MSLPSSSPSNRFRSTWTRSAASVCCPRLCERLHAVRGRPPPASSRAPSRGIRWEVRPCVSRRITPSHGLGEHLGPANLRRRAVMPAAPSLFGLQKQEEFPGKLQEVRCRFLPAGGGTWLLALTFKSADRRIPSVTELKHSIIFLYLCLKY